MLPLLIEIIDGNCLQISEPLRNFLILVGLLLKDASCSSILGEMIQFDQIQSTDELKMEIDVRGIDAVSFCLGTYCMFVYLLCLSVVVTSTMCIVLPWSLGITGPACTKWIRRDSKHHCCDGN